MEIYFVNIDNLTEPVKKNEIIKNIIRAQIRIYFKVL